MTLDAINKLRAALKNNTPEAESFLRVLHSSTFDPVQLILIEDACRMRNIELIPFTENPEEPTAA
jgi:hypothetical protein